MKIPFVLATPTQQGFPIALRSQGFEAKTAKNQRFTGWVVSSWSIHIITVWLVFFWRFLFLFFNVVIYFVVLYSYYVLFSVALSNHLQTSQITLLLEGTVKKNL